MGKYKKEFDGVAFTIPSEGGKVVYTIQDTGKLILSVSSPKDPLPFNYSRGHVKYSFKQGLWKPTNLTA